MGIVVNGLVVDILLTGLRCLAGFGLDHLRHRHNLIALFHQRRYNFLYRICGGGVNIVHQDNAAVIGTMLCLTDNLRRIP